MKDTQQQQPATPESWKLVLDDGDMLKVGALCFALSVLGTLCALWLAKNWK